MHTTITNGQLSRFLGLTSEKNVTPETLQIALANGTFADFLEFVATGKTVNRDQLRKLLGLPEWGDQFKTLIKRGQYSVGHPLINSSNFPVGMIPVLDETMILKFKCTRSPEGAMTEFEELGYRPATFAELLVYGLQNKSKNVGPGPVQIVIALGDQVAIGGNTMVTAIVYAPDGRMSLELFEISVSLTFSNAQLLGVPK